MADNPNNQVGDESKTSSVESSMASSAGLQDKAMGTAAEDLAVAAPPAEQPAVADIPTDKGLGAASPILKAGDQSPAAPVPGNDVPIPPQEAMRGAPIFSRASFQPPGPTEDLDTATVSMPGDEHPVDETILDRLITDDQMSALWERLQAAQGGIYKHIPNIAVARQLFDQIRLARVEILMGKAHYDEAERYINEVEYRVARLSKNSESNWAAWLLFGYEVVWALLMGWGMLGFGVWVKNVIQGAGVSSSSFVLTDVEILVNSILWGGLGGVVGALYALWRHVARDQDFDKQFSMWYVTNPIMGSFLGAFTFLAIRAGVFSLTSGGSSSATISSPYFLYVMAWIVGFQQNVAYDLVHRLLGIFKGDDSSQGVAGADSGTTLDEGQTQGNG